MACSMNLPNRDASGLAPGDAPSTAGGGVVAGTRVATAFGWVSVLAWGTGQGTALSRRRAHVRVQSDDAEQRRRSLWIEPVARMAL